MVCDRIGNRREAIGSSKRMRIAFDSRSVSGTAVFRPFVLERSEKISGAWAFRRAVEMKRREKIEGESGSEHLGQESEHFLRGGVVDFAHSFNQAHFVDGADLVQDDLSGLSLESDRNPRRILSPLRGHGRDDDGADVTVHLVGRDDQAGTGFADFAAFGGIEAD